MAYAIDQGGASVVAERCARVSEEIDARYEVADDVLRPGNEACRLSQDGIANRLDEGPIQVLRPVAIEPAVGWPIAVHVEHGGHLGRVHPIGGRVRVDQEVEERDVLRLLASPQLDR